MSGKRKVIAFRVTPIFEPEPGSLGTAAVMTCLATGRVLSGSGGGGDYLAPEIVKALRNDGEPKIVITEAEYDRLRAAAGESSLDL